MKDNTQLKKSLAQIEHLATDGHLKLALTICEKELKRFPQSTNHALAYLSLLPSSGRSTGAISRAIDSILSKFPGYPDLCLIAAEYYLSIANFQLAEIHADAAALLDPTFWEAFHILGQCYLALSKHSPYTKLISALKHSHYVVETERIIALLETRRLLQEDRQEEVRTYIINRAHLCWGESRLLQLLTSLNCAKTHSSQLWTLKLTSDYPIGFACMMQTPYYGTFNVIADSQAEALSFISELFAGNFFDESNVIELQHSPYFPANWQNKGVICVYPFARSTTLSASAEEMV